VHAASADPRQPPLISFNFLSAPADRALTVAAIRKARQVMTAPAMAALNMTEIAPGPAVIADEDILDWVRNTGQTTYHPVGTCKMGVDDMAVVDPRLRVNGITGLRVADASIMPIITSGNTNAPSIMIGEKAADMILEDAGAMK
jgi:choline dehydrogenase